LKHKVFQTVHSGPESRWESIKHAYFLLITNAKKHVWITTPYFIPDESTITALKNAALSGVDVRLVVPSKPDHYFPFHASRTYFEELMSAGVKIYEYQPGFMHAKCVTVDTETASVGTCNFDIRGFQLNFEVNMMIYSRDDVLKLENEIKDMIGNSKKIDYDTFRKRWVGKTVRESIARLFSPLL